MGYTTDFIGKIKIEPCLSAEEITFLNKFNGTRRMACAQGPYYVDRGGFKGQDHKDPSVTNYNSAPAGQPGLWCNWEATEDGQYIQWDGGEKFYSSLEWMQYLIDHFIGHSPIAKSELPFLQHHSLSGRIEAQGEDYNDRWLLVVEDNLASQVDHPRLGDEVTCPHCEEVFRLEE